MRAWSDLLVRERLSVALVSRARGERFEATCREVEGGGDRQEYDTMSSTTSGGRRMKEESDVEEGTFGRLSRLGLIDGVMMTVLWERGREEADGRMERGKRRQETTELRSSLVAQISGSTDQGIGGTTSAA